MIMEEMKCPCCHAKIHLATLPGGEQVPLDEEVFFVKGEGDAQGVDERGRRIKGHAFSYQNRRKGMVRGRLLHYAQCSDEKKLRAWVSAGKGEEKGGSRGGKGQDHPYAPRQNTPCKHCAQPITFQKVAGKHIPLDKPVWVKLAPHSVPGQNGAALAMIGGKTQRCLPCERGDEGAVYAKVLHRFTCRRSSLHEQQRQAQTRIRREQKDQRAKEEGRLTTGQRSVVQRAMTRLCRDLAGAKPGGRNNALYSVAWSAGRFAGAKALEKEGTREKIWVHAQACGLERDEFDKTFNSGFKTGFSKPWCWGETASETKAQAGEANAA